MRKRKKFKILLCILLILFIHSNSQVVQAADNYFTDGMPKIKAGQEPYDYYKDVVKHFEQKGFVERNDNGNGKGGTIELPTNGYLDDYVDKFKVYSIKRYEDDPVRDRYGEADYYFRFGATSSRGYTMEYPLTKEAYKTSKRYEFYPDTNYESLREREKTERPSDLVSGAPVFPLYPDDSQNLTFGLETTLLRDNYYDTTTYYEASMRYPRVSGDYTSFYQGLTYTETEKGGKTSYPKQFKWNAKYANLLWNVKTEQLVFVALDQYMEKMVAMDIEPTPKHSYFTNNFEIYPLTEDYDKEIRLVYSQLFADQRSGSIYQTIPDYKSLGNNHGFFYENAGIDKTIVNFRTDLPNGPENFGIQQKKIPFTDLSETGDRYYPRYENTIINQPLDTVLTAYNPPDSSGKGIENTAAGQKFGTRLGYDANDLFLMNYYAATSVSFKSKAFTPSTGESAKMAFSIAIDKLFDTPAIADIGAQEKNEDEDFKIENHIWYSQSPDATKLFIQPYVNGVAAKKITINKPNSETTSGSFDFTLPKELFTNIGGKNEVKVVVKDDLYDESKPENEKSNASHISKTNFNVGNRRKIDLKYEDTSGNQYTDLKDAPYALYALDNESISISVPATIGESKNPLEDVKPKSTDVSLDKKNHKLTVKGSDKFTDGITLIYKIVEVDGTVKRIDDKRNKPIFSNVASGTEISDYTLSKLKPGSSIDKAINDAINNNNNPLVLDFPEYQRIKTPKEYRILVKGQPVETTTVPDVAFTIEYRYQGTLTFGNINTLSFGSQMIAKTDQKVKVKDINTPQAPKLEVFNTSESANWEIRANLDSKGIYNTKTDKKFQGALVFKDDKNTDQPLTATSQRVYHNNGPTSRYHDLDLGEMLELKITTGNLVGKHEGTIEWSLNDIPTP
ncbi:hypothetical protein [Vagococcus silagei]|uniref:WxL domain-containing protein n=1 Tax=Vagococcus silagei TaxID=2508885 RepID=A0A4S3B2V8_9ENTE|nr:hypothetical protein [Vagococcus silagei]THB60060.1 hypothetical protein ESZ54_12430 [Vagococcus silagei]